MTIDYDLAIVGAGPAGCACALALSDKGLKIALIDKDVFPRDKICGDAIPGPSFKSIDNINKNWGSRLREFSEKVNISSSAVYFGGIKKITHNWLSFSYNCKRIDFDNFLFELVKSETNTTILEKKKVKKISDELTHINCIFHDTSSINVKMIVGCDGANSIVKRDLYTYDANESYSFAAIRAYYKGIEGIKEGENEFHFFKELDSYFWIFPLKNGFANIGLGVEKNKKKKNDSTTNVRKILEEIINSPYYIDRFKNAICIGGIKGFRLPIWTKTKPVSGNRFLLCGDAASLIDPLFGHGIDKAIWSGRIAANQIINCFKQNNFSSAFMRQYDELLNSKFKHELSRNRCLMKIGLRFPFLKKIVFWLFHDGKFTKWIIKKMKF